MTSKLLVSALVAALTVGSTTLSHYQQSSASNVQCNKNCVITDALINLITQFEGYSPFAYKDSAGNATIGVGHLITASDHIQEPLLPPDAAKLLGSDLEPKGQAVNALVKRPLQQNQFNALVSFTFNVGTSNLKRSTLLKKVNANDDPNVPPQFLKWANAGGEPVTGLLIRRKAEAKLYGNNPSPTVEESTEAP